MNETSLVVALLAASSLAAGQALAQPSSWLEAPVVEAEPLVEVITRQIPHESCRDERVRVERAPGNHSATPALMGALIGGVVSGAAGHHSRHQDVIAGAGALLGGSLGNDYSHRRPGSSYYVTERVCETEYELRDIERVVGYRVGYRYQGQVYYTRTATAPGDTIRLRVDVSPAP
ncbi:MAG: glycine zipper 2TM domain-containing protein [Parahaliea sp.]